MNQAYSTVITGGLMLSLGLSGGRALAQGKVLNCSDLPNPIYMSGTTAVEPLVRRFGAKLDQLAVKQTLLWNNNTDGCSSVGSLAYGDQTFLNKSTFQYYQEIPADGGTVVHTSSCNASITGVGDLAINDIFWTSCSQSYASSDPRNFALPATIKEFPGPVQGLVPIVPRDNPYDALTAEELLDIYVCGPNISILSFSNPNYVYDYNCITSGMREMWASSLGVQGSTLSTQIGLGCPNLTSATAMLELVAAPVSIQATIAYTSTEVYDENRDKVKVVKVRGIGQELAYLPDTDITRRDKINIREGRYTIQGALKLVAHVGADGLPDNPAAKRMIDWLQDNPIQDPTLQLPFNIVDVYAQSGVVPQCAMKVTKDTDAPFFRPYKPEKPCNCYFLTQASGAQSIAGCVPCVGTGQSSCGVGQVCSYGYCE